MPNASTDVLRRGWELYRTADPRPTLEQINAALTADGLGVVSTRAHKHYRNLDRYGQEDYLPINELDMQIKRRRKGPVDR